jgi:hypothetical protein
MRYYAVGVGAPISDSESIENAVQAKDHDIRSDPECQRQDQNRDMEGDG